MSFGGEGSSRERRDNESEEESKVLDNAFIVVERYQKHSELLYKYNRVVTPFRLR